MIIFDSSAGHNTTSTYMHICMHFSIAIVEHDANITNIVAGRKKKAATLT